MTEGPAPARTEPDILALIEPLSPFEMLEFCRALFEGEPPAGEGSELERAWVEIFAALPERHPNLAAHSPAELRRVYEGLLASYPELCALTTGPSTVEPARAMFLRMFYELISRSNAAAKMGFLNLGYASAPTERPSLDAEDEPNRYSIQLYHQLFASSFPPAKAAGKDIVEVGCGRGGGSDYFTRYLRPRSVTGVDITRASIDYCRRSYALPGLEFAVGRASELPLAAHSCDIVVNLESSHCYPAMPLFLAEVERVLRPGGHFLFSDIRHRDTLYRGYEPLAALEAQLAATGLELLERRDITDAVRVAIERDGEAQITRWDRALAETEGLGEDAAGYCLRHFSYAVGLTNEQRVTWHQRFTERDHVYMSYVLRKPG